LQVNLTLVRSFKRRVLPVLGVDFSQLLKSYLINLEVADRDGLPSEEVRGISRLLGHQYRLIHHNQLLLLLVGHHLILMLMSRGGLNWVWHLELGLFKGA
jgi:hypothetical protein